SLVGGSLRRTLAVIAFCFNGARLLFGGGRNLRLLPAIVVALAFRTLALRSAFRLALVLTLAALLVAAAAVAATSAVAVVASPAIAILRFAAVAIAALVALAAGLVLARVAFFGTGKEATEGLEQTCQQAGLGNSSGRRGRVRRNLLHCRHRDFYGRFRFDVVVGVFVDRAGDLVADFKALAVVVAQALHFEVRRHHVVIG